MKPDMPSSSRHLVRILDTRDLHEHGECKQQFKAALTELLNTQTMRSDQKYRQSVQRQLMDIEQLIRKERRRYSIEDRKAAASIAKHLSLTTSTSAEEMSDVS
jgi:hypothetical protein